MSLQLAVNTDFDKGTGSPLPCIEAARRAGFTHVIWGHQWDTDFLYSHAELNAISRCLETHNVSLLDVHGSSGVEKCWYSPIEYERLAGVELIRNRIEMTASLGGDTVVLHPMICNNADLLANCRAQGVRSLRELEAFVRNSGVVLALENLFADEHTEQSDDWEQCFETIEYFFELFSAEFLSFCWDTGHCFILGEGALERAAQLAKARLRALHLNDNRGDSDQHSPPLTWSDRWQFIAETIAGSPYPDHKPLALEINANPNNAEPGAFLRESYRKAVAFLTLLERCSARKT